MKRKHGMSIRLRIITMSIAIMIIIASMFVFFLYISADDILRLIPNNEVLSKLLISVALSVVLCIVVSIIIIIIGSNYFARPISRLVKEVIKNKDKAGRLYLEKSGISEIDELTTALEDISGEVYDLAARLTEIFNLVDERIGCFEYNLNTGKTYLTDNIFNMLNIEHINGDNYISNDEWFDILGEKIFKSILQENNLTVEYKFNNSENSIWIKVKSIKNRENLLGIITNITDEVEERKKLEYDRDYDILTGLYNRRAFRRIVSDIIEKDPKSFGAMIFMDLDNLKYINDTYGHEIGDNYIQCTAKNISVFKEIGAVISRISGDEFAIYIHGFTDKESAFAQIKEIFYRESKRFQLPGGLEKEIKCSSGIAYYPIDGGNYDELIKHADFAMYQVKHSVKGGIKEFDRDSYQRVKI
ncbi:GGDEF domain-containing protein [Clostridium sp. A1-XYC3]|uniref:GGDEF domain-containing protein n=1 Tax=Clostridium tanneri TaxID=3037988 RepID=A0ABU4JRN2_9CLOT|nr:GGDEF domain-containing protein [Clostridium sp. A1-XYC3]MDW8800794.1 GGDEF domain-containing protein [Clostridium sp. A1-XYC3]